MTEIGGPLPVADEMSLAQLEYAEEQERIRQEEEAQQQQSGSGSETSQIVDTSDFVTASELL